MHGPKDTGLGSWRIRVGPKIKDEAEPRQTDRPSTEEHCEQARLSGASLVAMMKSTYLRNFYNQTVPTGNPKYETRGKHVRMASVPPTFGRCLGLSAQGARWLSMRVREPKNEGISVQADVSRRPLGRRLHARHASKLKQVRQKVELADE